MPDRDILLSRARHLSWERWGKVITFYLPGMFRLDGVSGKYPAVSITGDRCDLACDHCRGTILRSMPATETPHKLLNRCLALDAAGYQGVLISGGCDSTGKLPWEAFIPAIREIKQRTRLFVSVHAGLIDASQATGLKAAGVDQALIDVIGDDQTLQRMVHVPFGVERIEKSLTALADADLPMIPHIVCGLNYGKMAGEDNALKMIARFKVEQLVIVSLMGIPGTPVCGSTPPSPEAVAGLIARARLLMPAVSISLGCARRRGHSRLETLAIDAGVNRLALPSDAAIARARHYGLRVRYQKTCCSVTRDLAADGWRSIGRPVRKRHGF